MKKWQLVFSYALIFFTSNGQDLTEHFKLLNARSGLASNLVNCLYKDHRGFLWIGTNNGLSRFDGKNVVNYSHQASDSNSIVNNGINSICEDDSGRIWVATEGGVSALNIYSNKFRNFLSIKTSDSIINIKTQIPAVTYYKKRVYIILLNGILVSRTDSINLTLCSKKDLHYSKRLRCLPNRAYSTKNGLWIATFAGLFYTEDGVNFMNKEYNPRRWSIFERGSVLSFFNDGDSVAYFGSWRFEGIYKFRYKTAQLDSFPFKGVSNILSIARIGKTEIWGGTFSSGVMVMDLETGNHHVQEQKGSLSKTISDIRVEQIIVDEQKTVFVGSSLGLFYVNPVQAQFSNINLEVDKIHTFPPSLPCTLVEDDDGKIWCGSLADGLFSFEPKKKVVQYFKFEGNYNNICAIHRSKNSLILGSTGGLAVFDLQTKKLTPIKLPVPLLDQTHDGISCIEHIYGDEYWIGLFMHGLLRLDIKTGQYKYFSRKDSLALIPGIIRESITVAGQLWLGFLEGGALAKIDNISNKITHLTLDTESKIYGSIEAMTSDKKGNIWVGTLAGGVVCIDPEGKKLAGYSPANGLTNNRVTFLQFDDSGNLWIGAPNGLNKLNLQTKKIEIFTYSDGMISSQFTDKIVLKRTDGIIDMISENYLISFDPARLTSSSILPKIQVLSIQKSGAPVVQKNMNDDISLSYNDKIISFEYTAINYIDPDKTQYAYKLEGFENKWNYSGDRNYMSYNNLPPGDYVFKIKATNKMDNWNVPEYMVRLNVKGPFWKTWWFFVLCFLLTFLLAFFIYYQRLQQFLKIQAIRDKISMDLHDDIGSALSSIAIYSEVAQKYSEGKVPEIVSILNSVQETANTAMENMSDIVWSINPANDRFSATVKRLEIFANQLLNARGINPQFVISESINDYKITMQQRKNVYLICKEAINNVAKYSGAKNCIVEMNENSSLITISIKDDGVGIEENKYTMGGNGILNMKSRARELKGLLDIISHRDQGTFLCLKFSL